jgi:ATP-dependent DNA helicase RecG
MMAVWFNQPWVARRLSEGQLVLLYGTHRDRNVFWVEEFEPLDGAAAAPGTGHVPLYPATEGITATRIRQLVWEDYGLFRHVLEPLPAAVRVAERVADRPAALAAIHFPDHEREGAEAHRRLAFEELLLLQLALGARRRARRTGRRARPLPATGELVEPWLGTLPFALTGDQRAAVDDIGADLAGERPMQRLLMGEVGTGKTVVALAAMLRALEHGAQAALMAPTETLAEQARTR